MAGRYSLAFGSVKPGPDAIAPMETYPAVRVVVLGSGTSTGVPMIGCSCPVCTSEDPRDNRLRTSITVELEGRTFLIDCGVDFRAQMLAHPTDRIDAVLITHTHADHVHGIDDLRAFCFRQREHMPIYTSAPFIKDIANRFYYAFNPPQKGGGVPLLDLKEIRPGETFEASGVRVLPLEIMHGKLRILGFRFGRFAYLTDCSAIPEQTEPLLEGVTTMILSALRKEPHPTHFNIEQALEASRRLGVERVYFIHMTHNIGHVATEKELPDFARLAYDGLTFEVN